MKITGIVDLEFNLRRHISRKTFASKVLLFNDVNGNSFRVTRA